MPEGPEIRRAADRLAAAVGGQTVVRAQFAFPRLKRFERELVGRRILSSAPRGKAVELTLSPAQRAAVLGKRARKGTALAKKMTPSVLH